MGKILNCNFLSLKMNHSLCINHAIFQLLLFLMLSKFAVTTAFIGAKPIKAGSNFLAPPGLDEACNNRLVRNGMRRTARYMSFELLNDSTSDTMGKSFTSLLLGGGNEITDVVSAPSAAIEPMNDTLNVIVFIIGIIPFAWATVEFWRRIAVGESFGTGSDSVVIPNPTTIGEDNNPESSRGRRVLGTDALVTAYILFALAGGTIALVLYAVLSSPDASNFESLATTAELSIMM